MSVIINLLPRTHQDQLKEQGRRRLFTGITIAIAGGCGAIIVIMVLVLASLGITNATLTKNIQTKKAQIQNVDGLTAALTAQQHLAALPQLYSQRPSIYRFLTIYSVAAPSDVVLTSLSLDKTGSLNVKGVANAYVSVAKLARAMEAVGVTVGNGDFGTEGPYFTDVVISSVNKDTGSVGFSLTATAAEGATHHVSSK